MVEEDGGEGYFAGVSAEDADYAGGELFDDGELGEAGELCGQELFMRFGDLGGFGGGHYCSSFEGCGDEVGSGDVAHMMEEEEGL